MTKPRAAGAPPFLSLVYPPAGAPPRLDLFGKLAGNPQTIVGATLTLYAPPTSGILGGGARHLTTALHLDEVRALRDTATCILDDGPTAVDHVLDAAEQVGTMAANLLAIPRDVPDIASALGYLAAQLRTVAHRTPDVPLDDPERVALPRDLVGKVQALLDHFSGRGTTAETLADALRDATGTSAATADQ